MARGAALLVVLGALVAVHSEQQTRVEDPTAQYYIEVLKTIITNTTRSLQGALTRLEDNTAKEDSLTNLEGSLRGVQDSVVSLQEKVLSIRNSVDNGVDRTRVELRMLRNSVSKELSNLRSLMERRTNDMGQKMAEMLAADCQDLYDLGFNASGTYYLQRLGRYVLCEMEGGDGGWLVVQRRARVTQQVDFNRGWDDYKKGFGDVDTEFWSGNDFLHVLTNQKAYKLHADMHDFEKGYYWAAYSTFRVGNEASDYALYVGNYTGNATDAFMYHHGRSFSTYDRDNDLYASGNCAKEFTGGWWYDRCYDAHLNGLFPVVQDRQNASFITWWAHEGNKRVPLVMDKVVLKVKPMSV